MKKVMSFVLALGIVCTLGACGSKKATDGQESFNGDITVVSREDGSGTRGAFVELLEITDKDGNDATYDGAEITNSTSVMLTTVSGNKNAIGYVSLGSLSDDVKAVSVDNSEATVDNIKSGDYTIARPFNVVYKEGKLTELAQDFMAYIMSKEGQAVIEGEGYISIDSTESYSASGLSGKVSLAGSTSVAPVMEVLADKYKGLNAGVTIEIQQSGSSAGISSAIEGVCDLGMASRELKDSEKTELKSDTIAMDGIAVIVNKENPTENLTKEQIKSIFSGESLSWSDVAK